MGKQIITVEPAVTETEALLRCSLLRAEHLRCGETGAIGRRLDEVHLRLTKLQDRLRRDGRSWPEVLAAMEKVVR
jgi:hypothetical protein